MNVISSRLAFIYGPHGCGKSFTVEEELKTSGVPVLYLATLPNTEQFRDVIEQHRRRRPKSWATIELNEPISEEVLSRAAALEDGVVLLEGLHVYACQRARHLWDVESCSDSSAAVIDGELQLLEASSPHLIVVSAPLFPIDTHRLPLNRLSTIVRSVNRRIRIRADLVVEYRRSRYSPRPCEGQFTQPDRPSSMVNPVSGTAMEQPPIGADRKSLAAPWGSKKICELPN